MARSKEPQIVEGRVDDSDDEEIDEDEAFNSEDELMYGDLFSCKKSSSSSSKKSMGGKGRIKPNAGDSSDEDDSDGGSGDDGDDSDDGGSDENDWAGSSDDSEEDDDGGQYMLDLLSNLDRQVPGKSDKSGKRSEGGRISLSSAASEAAARLPEGEFQAGALSAMSSSDPAASGDGKLTLDSLMGGIADTADFASVQRSMRVLSSGRSSEKEGSRQKKMETTAAPVSRAVSERASRKVHTEATKEEVSRWTEAVHEQRDAETLDFRTNGGGAATNRVTGGTLVDKFEATTDFEKELQEALETAGMEDEKEMRKKERRRLTGKDGGNEEDEDGDDDDLGRNRITVEEYKKRHGELAKLRSLMFHEEQKRHRINKIKSKKYRKIRKRRQDRLQNAEEEAARLDGGDAQLDRERVEREEMERMEERMTLAHKNTSKWARRMLKRGSKMDVEERRALSLQIARGEELRRKAMGEEEDEAESSEGETEEGLLKKARDILMENDDDDGDGDDSAGKKKKKGLFQLEFMKRGMEAQRTRAKEEARRLLEELEANEAAALSTDSEDDCDDEEKWKSKEKPKRAATEEEMNRVLPGGKLVASSLKFGKADGFAVKIDGNIELGDADGDGKDTSGKSEGLDETRDEQENAKGKKKKRKKKKQKQEQKASGEAANSSPPPKKHNNTASSSKKIEEEEENPWIVSKRTKKSSKPLSTTVNINEAASMLVDNDGKKSSGKRKQQDDGSKMATKKEKDDLEQVNDEADATPDVEKEVAVAELSQAELVRRAFAAPADLEAEEEFQKEKDRMRERDDPTRKQNEDSFVSGWGSWAGAGAPPPRKKPRKLPPKLRPPAKKAEADAPKRKDDGLSTVIVNEKRLKKTAKFQLSEIPYPYRSREEYERAMAGNMGHEWNTIQGTKEMSRPAVLVRAGKMIQPIGTRAKSKAKQQRRAPAKF